MVDAPKAPSGNGLLVSIGVASCIVFIAGVFDCVDAGGWNGDGNGNNGRWDDDGNNGRGWGNNGVCNGNTAWALACGLVSMIIVLVMLVGPMVGGCGGCVSSAKPFVGAFLFLWWLIGAGVITFAGPYTIASNGYFGSWVACVGSVLYGMEVSDFVQQAVGFVSGPAQSAGPAMAGLVISSIIELIAASISCRGGCLNDNAYAVAVGAVSLGLCIVIMAFPKCLPQVNQFMPYIILLLCLWWLAAGIVLTFRWPFAWAGNGYFATWVAVVCVALVYKDSDAPGASSASKVSTSNA